VKAVCLRKTRLLTYVMASNTPLYRLGAACRLYLQAVMLRYTIMLVHVAYRFLSTSTRDEIQYAMVALDDKCLRWSTPSVAVTTTDGA
jgi:hypothetical protein